MGHQGLDHWLVCGKGLVLEVIEIRIFGVSGAEGCDLIEFWAFAMTGKRLSDYRAKRPFNRLTSASRHLLHEKP